MAKDNKELHEEEMVNPCGYCALHIAEGGDGLQVRHNPDITIKLLKRHEENQDEGHHSESLSESP